MGDLVHNGQRPKLWRWFFSIMRKLLPNTPFYTTPGNHCGAHDHGETTRVEYGLCPSTTWGYYVRYGSALFVTLNSLIWDDPELELAQRAWFEAVMRERGPDIQYTVVWTHFPWYGPPYASSGEEAPYEQFIRENWEPLFQQYRVDLVLGGHKHSYARYHQTRIITASIHGVRKYPWSSDPDAILQNRHHILVLYFSPDALVVQARSWFGTQMDEYVVRKQARG
jgi:hypothetical protein